MYQRKNRIYSTNKDKRLTNNQENKLWSVKISKEGKFCLEKHQMIFSPLITRRQLSLNKLNFSSNENRRCSRDFTKNRKNMNKGEIRKNKKIKRI